MRRNEVTEVSLPDPKVLNSILFMLPDGDLCKPWLQYKALENWVCPIALRLQDYMKS